MTGFIKSWLGTFFSLQDLSIAQDKSLIAPSVAIVDATGTQITSFGGGGAASSVQVKDSTNTLIDPSTKQQLPASLGAKTGALSLSVVPNTDTAFPISATQLPSTLGAKTGALSLSVVPNTDTVFSVAGNAASATTTTVNPVDISGIYNTTQPTLTNGQRNVLQQDTRANLKVTLFSTDSTTSVSFLANNSDNLGVSSTASRLGVVNFPLKFNGASYDRDRKPNLYARVASSAASGNPAFLKASAGDITLFWGVCGATAVFLQIYNKASAPTIGTDTPVLTYPIPANSNFTQSIPNGGAFMSTGIAYAFTTDAAATTASAAAAITSFALFGS